MLVVLNFKLFVKKFSSMLNNKYITWSFIFLILIVQNYASYVQYSESQKDVYRLDRTKITVLLSENKLINFPKTSFLVFDEKLMTWAIFKNSKTLHVVDGTYALRDNSQIENDLIYAFRFLNLPKNEFNNFIQNKQEGYRFINHDLRLYFWQRYQANSFYKFKNSSDFDKDVLTFLNNLSPFYAHSFALPNFEINRLINKFENTNKTKKINPSIVILDKEHDVFKKSIINDNLYCKAFSGRKLDLYIIKSLCTHS